MQGLRAAAEAEAEAEVGDDGTRRPDSIFLVIGSDSKSSESLLLLLLRTTAVRARRLACLLPVAGDARETSLLK